MTSTTNLGKLLSDSIESRFDFVFTFGVLLIAFARFFPRPRDESRGLAAIGAIFSTTGAGSIPNILYQLITATAATATRSSAATATCGFSAAHSRTSATTTLCRNKFGCLGI